jgi:hypothetical protein
MEIINMAKEKMFCNPKKISVTKVNITNSVLNQIKKATQLKKENNTGEK